MCSAPSPVNNHIEVIVEDHGQPAGKMFLWPAILCRAASEEVKALAIETVHIVELAQLLQQVCEMTRLGDSQGCP